MTPGLKILLYLTAWILPVYTNAQAVISGRVLDSLSQPVEMASVIVRSCNDDRVLAFCNTDQSGNFSLKPELSGCDTPTLHVRSLGYNPFRMKLSG
ncbi:MAG: Carboxypeptidase regulatory-like domain, partial [Bacteroidota bacterium]